MDNNTIQVTKDYDQFNFMEANREQSRGHIEALKSAFEEMGNLTRVQPILVNERMEIIDGQHRFTACKELDESIFYTVVPGLSVSDARQMNILHRGWGVEDFSRSYAAGGDGNYQRFLELVEEYGYSHSILIHYVHNSQERGMFKAFRNGEFVLRQEDMPAVKSRLDKLSEVVELDSKGNTLNFAIAYMTAMSNPNFDTARFLSRLERNPHLLTRQAGVPEYLRVIEDIYNHGMASDNRLRLF